jgi:hypothetical protein
VAPDELDALTVAIGSTASGKLGKYRTSALHRIRRELLRQGVGKFREISRKLRNMLTHSREDKRESLRKISYFGDVGIVQHVGIGNQRKNLINVCYSEKYSNKRKSTTTTRNLTQWQRTYLPEEGDRLLSELLRIANVAVQNFIERKSLFVLELVFAKLGGQGICLDHQLTSVKINQEGEIKRMLNTRRYYRTAYCAWSTLAFIRSG